METFVEITNSAKTRSNLNLVFSGVQANKSGWKPYSFYPNNGVVGVLIGKAQCYEGFIYIVQCGEKLLVPILPSGIRQITREEYNSRYPRNMQVGKASSQQLNSVFDVDEMKDSLMGSIKNMLDVR